MIPVNTRSRMLATVISRRQTRVVIVEEATMNPPLDTPPLNTADVVIISDLAEARRVQDAIEQLLETSAAHTHDVFSIKLALEEALVNAIKHGNQLDRAKKVYISYRLHINRFEVQITDEGPGVRPGRRARPDRHREPRAPLRARPDAHAPLHERGLIQL